MNARGDDDCDLQRLLVGEQLKENQRDLVQTAIEAGLTLRRQLPHVDRQVLTEWLGQRHYLLHQSQLARGYKWSSITSSRLSRCDAEFNQWPQWLSAAYRQVLRERQTLLLIEDTATAALLRASAKLYGLACLSVRTVPERANKSPPTRIAWLTQCLTQALQNKSVVLATLWVSPAENRGLTELEALPLQDRLSIVMARRVINVSLRPAGNIDALLQRRLSDERFPVASVWMRVPNNNRWAQLSAAQRAVGWYLQPQQQLASPRTRASIKCRQSEAGQLVQWSANLRLLGNEADYLVHCVRGNDSGSIGDLNVPAVVDALARGTHAATSAYETLWQIIHEGRIRASNKLLRGDATAVSLSAVTLTELLSRRRYQAHLGRWDWEPYGLMIRREAMIALGARPVIYGDGAVAGQLSELDRPFYQPARRRSASRPDEHWQAEREWRVLDDVLLQELPPHSAMLFVKYADQAQELATHCNWPVIYLQADRTEPRPTSLKTRRHSAVRTIRN